MRKDRVIASDAKDLRRRAEESIKKREIDTILLSEADVRRLLLELEIHQVELEMQNDELRTARMELEGSLERYTELFDFAPIGYVVLGFDQTIREINHAGASLLAKLRSRLVGLPFTCLIAPDHQVIFDSFLEKTVQSQTKQSCEVQLLGKGDATMLCHLTAALLSRPEPAAMIAFEDISDRKAKEKKLESAERALRDANRRKDDFLAALSHQLHNPLAPIRNSLHVLARADPTSEPWRRAQLITDRQMAHLTHLINDLLDVTRITRGKIQLQCQRVELGEMVRRTMDDHRSSFEASGVSLQGLLGSERYWVDADPARIVQVVSHLLGNAEKFTDPGGSVVVDLRREGQYVALRVRDTGSGISQELIDQLFVPFAQAPQTMDRSRGGLGLGLAMVKGLVELHDGMVGIASGGEGLGSEFKVLLPLETAPALAAPSGKPGISLSRRVLVIDDNPDAAQSLGDALALSGHEMQVASDGRMALELARRFRPEMVICDIGLPGMDGYAVARAFRADPELSGTFLVALSGYARPEDVQSAANAGFNHHLAKPPSLETLDRLLAELPVAAAEAGQPATSQSAPLKQR